MASPVTGPIVTSIETSAEYRRTISYRQRKPYDTVLPYDHKHVTGVPNSGISYNAVTVAGDISVLRSSGRMPYLRNKAYSRFKDKLGDPASTLVTLAQINQSCEMILGRAVQLRRFFSSLRKGDFAQAIQWAKESYIPNRAQFKVRPKDGAGGYELKDKGKWVTPKGWANLWLEWSFGWAPLLNDVQAAFNVIGAPGPKERVHGSCRENLRDVPWTGINTSIPGYEFHQNTRISCVMSVRTGATIKVTNPNLYLYNQLGIANPLPAIWDIIPWSFVVDWVTNASDFLNSGSDLWGLSLDQAFTSECLKEGLSTTNKWYLDTRPATPLSFNETVNFQFSSLVRTQGLVSPTFQIRPVWITSWKRAANAISLLTQMLPSK